VAWERKEYVMYHWIKDREFLGKMKRLCSDIVNQLVQEINKDDRMSVRAFLVGSGARNLFTQNGNQPIDLDYNLEIMDYDYYDFRNGREIKEYIRKKFNIVLEKNDFSDCQDSTSALTTGEIQFTQGSQTKFSIDICIVKQNSYGWHRLIHNKYGNIYTDPYRWEIVRDSKGLDDRVEWLKNNDLWEEVRETYLDKKKSYLCCPYDNNHPSFIVYIESVNEVYNKY